MSPAFHVKNKADDWKMSRKRERVSRGRMKSRCMDGTRRAWNIFDFILLFTLVYVTLNCSSVWGIKEIMRRREIFLFSGRNDRLLALRMELIIGWPGFWGDNYLRFLQKTFTNSQPNCKWLDASQTLSFVSPKKHRTKDSWKTDRNQAHFHENSRSSFCSSLLHPVPLHLLTQIPIKIL